MTPDPNDQVSDERLIELIMNKKHYHVEQRWNGGQDGWVCRYCLATIDGPDDWNPMQHYQHCAVAQWKKRRATDVEP